MLRKKFVNKLMYIFILLCISVKLQAQINFFFLTDPISYNLSGTKAIKQLRSNKEITYLKVEFDPDSTNSIITSITYRRAGIDSASIRFLRNHFSSINISFSDSCAFNYCKSYFFENFKFSKKQKQRDILKFISKEYDFYLMRGFDKLDSKYSLNVVSRKYKIKI